MAGFNYESSVLVQPEMERGRSPLVSIPPFGAGIFKASMSPPGYPSARLRPRRARFRFARQDHCSSTTSIGLNFRIARQRLESLANVNRNACFFAYTPIPAITSAKDGKSTATVAISGNRSCEPVGHNADQIAGDRTGGLVRRLPRTRRVPGMRF
jgi:hypothetical protein